MDVKIFEEISNLLDKEITVFMQSLNDFSTEMLVTEFSSSPTPVLKQLSDSPTNFSKSVDELNAGPNA